MSKDCIKANLSLRQICDEVMMQQWAKDRTTVVTFVRHEDSELHLEYVQRTTDETGRAKCLQERVRVDCANVEDARRWQKTLCPSC